MSTTLTDLTSDHELARELADAAAALLMALRRELTEAGASAADLKAQGDRRANDLLMDLLGEARPHDGVLSEEGRDGNGPNDTRRLSMDRVWIIDPLDGTREFSEPPRQDWAVHVALAVAGEPVVGAVALPAQATTLSTAAPVALAPAPPSPPRLVLSRTRRPPVATHVAEVLGAELVEMGSAGAKVCAVVTGQVDMYVHGGGMYEWDSCAPVAVARSAGLWVSRLDGSDLVYNNADPYLPDLLVCHPSVAEAVLRSIAEFNG